MIVSQSHPVRDVVSMSRYRRHDARSRSFYALALAAMLVAGCAKDATNEESTTDAAKPAVAEVDRGPVHLKVIAAKDTITIAERLDLRVEVTADPEIEVKLPDFGESLAQFQIRDYHELPVEVGEDGKRTYAQAYDLDIFLSGEYTIPGITAKYRVSNPEAADAPFAELTTEPLTINVTSMLEGEFDPQEFRDVKAAATLPVERDWWTIASMIAGGVLAVVAIIVLMVWWARRARRPADLIRIPPHEWALEQLRALANAGLVEKGEVQDFYYRLSEIERRYIERRFGLMAPERTTEEFLIEMRAGSALEPAHQIALGDFLEACDMVKYARHDPTANEIETVFNTARDFILQTSQHSSLHAPDAQEVAA